MVARPRPAELDLSRAALITQECQGAVVGPAAGLGTLAEEARLDAIPNIARLLPVARAVGVTVVHCVMHRRADGKGGNRNARLFAASARLDLEPGGPGASVLPELCPAPSDLVLPRYHGLGPMGGTELDAILRNLDITTVVPVGVSVNVAILNLVMDAVNAGYHVVLPRDAVAGVPRSYAESVIDNTLALIVRLTTTDELIGWLSTAADQGESRSGGAVGVGIAG